jgi:hypothetical protein
MRVAERWFSVDEVDEGVLRITEPHALPLIRANLFLVRGRARDLLIDSGLGIGRLRAELVELLDRPVIRWRRTATTTTSTERLRVRDA